MMTPNLPAQVVHIVDDDAVIRDALRWLFESRGIAAQTYPSAEDFIARYQASTTIDCLVLDMRMENMSGLELQDYLIAHGIRMPILFLSGHGNIPLVVNTLQRGAIDFLEKPFNDNQLVDKVIAALSQEAQRRAHPGQAEIVAQLIDQLTPREREVMHAVLAGKMNKVIADELGISMRTVEVHRARILEKMGVRSAVELASLIAQSGSKA